MLSVPILRRLQGQQYLPALYSEAEGTLSVSLNASTVLFDNAMTEWGLP